MFLYKILNIQKIQTDNDFNFIFSLLPNLMVGLHYIWTMSNYYCYDKKMEILLNKISFVFTEKVKEIIKLNHIFNYTANESYNLAINCSKLLSMWKQSYMDTRLFIENSGVGSRWEFNKTFLFEDVDHCKRISQDIADIAEVIILYY